MGPKLWGTAVPEVFVCLINVMGCVCVFCRTQVHVSWCLSYRHDAAEHRQPSDYGAVTVNICHMPKAVGNGK